MKLDTKAFTLTVAIVWGGAVLMAGITNLIWNGYAVAFLALVASIYPGYDGLPTAWSIAWDAPWERTWVMRRDQRLRAMG